MDVITVNVGQGALAIVRNNNEALIVDVHIPPSGDDTVAYVKKIFSGFLKNYNVRGLILTGFDKDHSCAMGVGLVLKKYRPDWIMYPKYYKDTSEATKVFEIINQEIKTRENSTKPLKKLSVLVGYVQSRVLSGLSDNFEIELFSPHYEDMDSSNNSSVVLKLTGRGSKGFSYLITGDTENTRWESINKIFGDSIKSDVMAAPHHGSRNGANAETLTLVSPNTILISAGVESQYGHPDSRAVAMYNQIAKHVFSTNVNGGVSLFTKRVANDFSTQLFK